MERRRRNYKEADFWWCWWGTWSRSLERIELLMLVMTFMEFVQCADVEGRRSIGKALFFYIEKPKKLAYTYEVRSSEEIGAPFPERPQKHIALRYAEPPNACMKMEPLDDQVVLLIERGDCTFIVKARMASAAGAQFAIITDSAAGTDDWIEMIGDGLNRKSDIPVAYLPGISGRRIREHLLYGGEVITVTIPLNYSSLLLNDVPRKPPWELW